MCCKNKDGKDNEFIHGLLAGMVAGAALCCCMKKCCTHKCHQMKEKVVKGAENCADFIEEALVGDDHPPMGH